MDDRVAGAVMIAVSIIVMLTYIYLVFTPPPITVMGDPIDIFTLKVMGLVALATIFGLLSWIGYTLITSPRPEPEELDGGED